MNTLRSVSSCRAAVMPRWSIPPTAPPTISARIQDLYDIKDGIWIANRRVPVRIQVLAPSNRPVQVTDNLIALLARNLSETQTAIAAPISQA